jgi:hypothetical protein
MSLLGRADTLADQRPFFRLYLSDDPNELPGNGLRAADKLADQHEYFSFSLVCIYIISPLSQTPRA